LRLAKYFGTSEMFWLNLKTRFDLNVQREKVGTRLACVRPFRAPPAPARSTRALVTAAKSGAARSGYRRNAK